MNGEPKLRWLGLIVVMATCAFSIWSLAALAKFIARHL